MLRAVISLSLAACCGLVSPAEVAPLGERDLKQADVSAGEGDLQSAITLLFKILRRAEEKEIRGEAREQLERLGVTKQEIFSLDPATFKPDDWEKLLARVETAMSQRHRQKLDAEYAEGLLHAAIACRIMPGGTVKVAINPKDLAQGLDLLLRVALAEGGAERSRDAQETLEQLGVAGPQVDVVRKAAADGALPAAIQNEIVCAACIHRLHRYREWVESTGEEQGDLVRRQLARQFGVALFKYLSTQHAQTPAMKRPSETLDFWRDLAAPGADKTF
jgi:citrate lyase gamma subunit